MPHEADAGHPARPAEAAPGRPRVALVAYTIGFNYAIPRIVAEQIARLHREVEFVVVSAWLAEELRDLVEWRRVPTLERSARLRHGSFILAAPFVLRRVRADLVHVFLVLPSRADIAAVQWCFAGFYEAAGHTREGNRLSGLARRLAIMTERWCYTRRVHTLAAASRASKRELERLFPGTPVALVQNGVDPGHFRPDAGARAELRAAEGLADDDVVVLFVGGDWARKGLAAAIGGVAESERLGAAPACLWVLGKGDESRYRELARRHGVEDRIRFFGFRADTVPYYRAADIFVLPTFYEHFPLVSLEAAATGLPIVGTRANGLEQLIGEDETGLAVEPDAASVGAALARLVADTALRSRLGQAARERAASYTWDATAQSLLALYRELLATRAR